MRPFRAANDYPLRQPIQRRAQRVALQHLGTEPHDLPALRHLAVQVRWLHDLGRSGWWSLIGLIPIAGVIIVLVWMAGPGDLGEDNCGPDPKGPAYATP